MERVDVAIIGGGIAGICSAFHLAGRGLSVALFERGAIGAGASGVNFGGVRAQGRDLAEVPLSLRARELWADLPDLVGSDCEYTRSGHVKLAFSEADMAGLEDYARRAGALGLRLEIVGANRLRAEHSWIGPDVVGASLAREDGHANPRLVTPAFAAAARRRGAVLYDNTGIDRVEAEGGDHVLHPTRGAPIRSRWLVNAAGAWSAAFAARWGEPVPLLPIAPHAMVTEPLPAFMSVSLGICGGGVALRQTRQGSVVIGGGECDVALDPGRARPRAEVLAAVRERAVRACPRLAGALILRAWAGVEGDMPDHVPVLGPSGTMPRIVHAFGFSQHGFQLGPAVGEAVADWITEGAPRVDVAGLSIARFRGRVAA